MHPSSRSSEAGSCPHTSLFISPSSQRPPHPSPLCSQGSPLAACPSAGKEPLQPVATIPAEGDEEGRSSLAQRVWPPHCTGLVRVCTSVRVRSCSRVRLYSWDLCLFLSACRPCAPARACFPPPALGLFLSELVRVCIRFPGSGSACGVCVCLCPCPVVRLPASPCVDWLACHRLLPSPAPLPVCSSF